jgi:hypothetical protein
MQIRHKTNKGSHVLNVEEFHMYKETRKGVQINDESTVTENTIYDILVKYGTLHSI